MREPKPAISRVLSGAIIHLGRPSPAASSNLPGSPLGTGGAGLAPCYFPIWSCSGRGLPCRGLLPAARCALTAPFHPYQPSWRYIFCGTFHGLTPPRRYLAPCPKEPGLSSALKQRLPGRLRLSQAAHSNGNRAAAGAYSSWESNHTSPRQKAAGMADTWVWSASTWTFRRQGLSSTAVQCSIQRPRGSR